MYAHSSFRFLRAAGNLHLVFDCLFFIGINVSDLGIQLLDHWFSESPRRTLYKSLELVHFYFLLNLFKVFSELIVQNLFEVSLLYNFQVFILPFL